MEPLGHPWELLLALPWAPSQSLAFQGQGRLENLGLFKIVLEAFYGPLNAFHGPLQRPFKSLLKPLKGLQMPFMGLFKGLLKACKGHAKGP